MTEDNVKREPGIRPEAGDERTSLRSSRGAGAPWWLVIVLLLGLVAMASYIAWINADTLKNRLNYVSDFWDSRDSEAELLSPAPAADSGASWENAPLDEGTLAPDSEAREWKSGQEPAQVTPVSEADPTVFPAPGVDQPAPAATITAPEPGYYIKAGEFTSRRAALARISELRQGNYWGEVIEPDSAGGTYMVAVGEFASFNKAKEKARTIGFILDIRTSVVKKE